MEIIDKHICKTCNKSYSSYSSLWNHVKNIHKINSGRGKITESLSAYFGSKDGKYKFKKRTV